MRDFTMATGDVCLPGWLLLMVVTETRGRRLTKAETTKLVEAIIRAMVVAVKLFTKGWRALTPRSSQKIKQKKKLFIAPAVQTDEGHC